MSGTPPSDMLYTAPVTYDQGWDLTKVFEPNRDDSDVKAFRWGSLTSKSSLSAFLILLATVRHGRRRRVYERAAQRLVEDPRCLKPTHC